MQPQLKPEEAVRHYSVAEYMALEEDASVRHEYFEGEVFAMAGGSVRHSILIGNCFFHLKLGLRGKPCRVFSENVQLAVEKGKYYNYPDVLVTCTPADLEAERTMTAPVLIIEVLSKSTENRDRSWKFTQYKQLASLKHYILVSQKTCLVEWYRWEEGGNWVHMPFPLFSDEFFIPELNLTLRVGDIYEDSGIAQMSIRPDAEEA